MLRSLLLLFLVVISAGFVSANESLRVLSYNILRGGLHDGQPLSHTVEVLRAANADIIGIQERGNSIQALADALDFFVHPLGSSTAILSRFPITETTANGVTIETASGTTVAIYNVHLAPYPYQPYDLRDEKIATEAETIASARASRSMTAVLEEMEDHLSSGMPVFLVGDFNEPSHIDWTAEAVGQGMHPITVAWPTSSDVVNAGMKDAYREIFPDPVTHPAFTWTPGVLYPNVSDDEVHDRIDLVYFAGDNIRVVGAAVIGPDEELSDIIVTPYPSDHRAVLADFVITP